MSPDSDWTYKRLFDSLPQIAWIVAPDGSATTMNAWGARYTGVTVGKDYFDTWKDLIHPDDISRAQAAWTEAVASDEVLTTEYRLKRELDGAYRWHTVSMFPTKDDAGAIVHWVGLHTDIHDRKQGEMQLSEMQAQLLHASRLSVLGQISSSLAHEVNQPLSAVDNYIDTALLLLDSATAEVMPRIHRTLTKAALQVQRAGDIIRNLRAFVRKGEMSLHPEPLDSLLRETVMLAMTRAELRRVKVRWHVDPDATWASINRVQIQQVLVNLLRNAVEAMADSEPRELEIGTARAGSGLIEIRVSDAGPGIHEKLAGELFKPFVSTKPNGIGIGLAICRSIVEAHGGTIAAEPRPGGGTVFRFTLARCEPTPGPAQRQLPV